MKGAALNNKLSMQMKPSYIGRRLLSRTFIAREKLTPGFIASKDRLSS